MRRGTATAVAIESAKKWGGGQLPLCPPVSTSFWDLIGCCCFAMARLQKHRSLKKTAFLYTFTAFGYYSPISQSDLSDRNLVLDQYFFQVFQPFLLLQLSNMILSDITIRLQSCFRSILFQVFQPFLHLQLSKNYYSPISQSDLSDSNLALDQCFFRSFSLISVQIKFIYSEKASQFCEIFTLLLTGTPQNKSK